MLMALIFTAKHDYKNALKLVLEQAANFPGHYGLLVLRLKLEAKFGRVDRALKTSRHLLTFWRRSNADAAPLFDEDTVQMTVHSLVGGGENRSAAVAVENDVAPVPSAARMVSQRAIGARHLAKAGEMQSSIALLTSKDALGPVTPIFTAPLGISAAALPPQATVGASSAVDVTGVMWTE